MPKTLEMLVIVRATFRYHRMVALLDIDAASLEAVRLHKRTDNFCTTNDADWQETVMSFSENVPPSSWIRDTPRQGYYSKLNGFSMAEGQTRPFF